jgi:hypothetical protein
MRVPTKTSSLSGKTGAEAVAEQIRIRSYELYEAHGREGGHDMEDWLRAEAETEIKKPPANAERQNEFALPNYSAVLFVTLKSCIRWKATCSGII